MRQEFLLAANAVSVAVIACLAVFVDSNGRLAGLSSRVSLVVTAVTFVTAFTLAAILIGTGRGWARATGAAMVVFYVAMLLPAILL